MIFYMEYPSPVGNLLLTCEDGALTGLWMNREPSADMVSGAGDPLLLQTVRWLDGYFAGEPGLVTFPINPAGTAFQQRIWQRLLQIPYGQTVTYGDIARELERQTGERMSSQAVGGAVGRNPISILIPCHRVVGAGGKLTGYAGGLDKKVWLLHHEGWKGEK